MALSFEDGMAALRGMFPTWDPELLSELLEANEGHLENTIDMALSMEPPPAGDAAAPTPAEPSRVAEQPPPASVRVQRQERRVTLPDDFLRLPSDPAGGGADLSEQEQRDAVLAQMLQDEIFRQELMENDEFSSHFQSGRGQRSASRAQPPEKSAAEIANETLTVMSEKFTSMSEAMKKKMNEMYVRFQARSDTPAGSDPYSHRPLMADDSSDDEDDGAGNADVRRRTREASGQRGSPRQKGPVSRRPQSFSSKKDD